MHCLLWVKDASHIDVQSDEDLCKFIDLFVSGMIPEDTAENKNIQNMMISLERYKHSQYCQRSVRTCRFAFHKVPFHTHSYVGNHTLMIIMIIYLKLMSFLEMLQNYFLNKMTD